MSFKAWYEQNKDKVAERRKRKYEQDEEYRKKRLAEAKRYYWMKKRRAEAIDARRIDVEAMNYGQTACCPSWCRILKTFVLV